MVPSGGMRLAICCTNQQEQIRLRQDIRWVNHSLDIVLRKDGHGRRASDSSAYCPHWPLYGVVVELSKSRRKASKGQRDGLVIHDDYSQMPAISYASREQYPYVE